MPAFFFALTAMGVGTAINMAAALTTDSNSLERGRYLVRIAGCNDCHTPGYLLSEGKTPEELWLTGDSFGWRGFTARTQMPDILVDGA